MLCYYYSTIKIKELMKCFYYQVLCLNNKLSVENIVYKYENDIIKILRTR